MMVRMQTAASSADEPPSPPTTSFPAHFAASEAAALHLPTRTSKETSLKTSLFTLFPSKTAISQASPFPSPTGPTSLPARLLAHLVGGEDGQLPLLAAQLLEAHTGGSSWSEDRQGWLEDPPPPPPPPTSPAGIHGSEAGPICSTLSSWSKDNCSMLNALGR